MLICSVINPIHPIGNSLKKQKSMCIVLTPSPSIQNPISLWVSPGSYGCYRLYRVNLTLKLEKN